MRKITLLTLSMVAAAFVFGACSGSGGQTAASEAATTAEMTAASEAATTAASETTMAAESSASTEAGAMSGVKTGLAIRTTVGKSKSATAEKEGLVQANSVVAAVIVDEEGRLVKVALDTIQTKAAVSAEGKITTDLETAFPSKVMLGDDYGMKATSGIGKEWYEQAAAFVEYAEGKTLEELKGLAVNEDGKTTDADLATSVTVSVDGYIEVIEKAVANAKVLGAGADDMLGLAMDSTIRRSKDATADAEGVVEAYNNYVAVTIDKDGKITSSVIDASQAKVSFNAAGELTSDLDMVVPSKVELGDDYGMKAASGIGKEWYEQMGAFSEYIAGKTPEEVMMLELGDDNTLADEDARSSVTVHVNDQIRLIDEAAKLAR